MRALASAIRVGATIYEGYRFGMTATAVTSVSNRGGQGLSHRRANPFIPLVYQDGRYTVGLAKGVDRVIPIAG